MRIVIIGPGCVGCGALGMVLARQGHEVVFAARRGEIIDSLNRHGYTVVTKGEVEERIEVRGVRAMNLQGPEFAREVALADQIYTTVRPDNLPEIAPLLALALVSRIASGVSRPLDVFCCENLKNAGSQLERLVFTAVPAEYMLRLQDCVAFNAAISDRIVSSQKMDASGRMVITADATGAVLFDALQIKGDFKAQPPFQGFDDFPACIEEKLYVVNCGHAVCAYLGRRRGYAYIHEAMADQTIRRAVVGAMLESQRALQYKHGRAIHYAGSIDKYLESFSNAALMDTIARVGRDPVRKLQAGDRLVGPAKLAYRYGVEPTYLIQGCAAALSFTQAGDPQAVALQKLLRERGPEWALSDVCQLRPWNPVSALIRDELRRMAG